MSYAEKLKDPRWQKKRLEILEAAGWKCEFLGVGLCNSGDNATLHVHHKCYKRNTDPWDYPSFVYSVLCDDCHKWVQGAMEEVHLCIARNSNLFWLLDAISRKSKDKDTENFSRSLSVAISLGVELGDVARIVEPLTSIAETSFTQGLNKSKPNNDEAIH